MSEHEQITNLLADLIASQNETTMAVVKLTEAIAGIRMKADAPAVAAIAKAKAQPAVASNTGSSGSDQTQVRTCPVADAGSSVSSPTELGATTTQSEATALTYPEHVAPLLSRILAEKGALVLKELLGRFAAKKGAELQSKDFALAVEQAQEILNG